MSVKLTEVARKAGVSLATASRVLNGSARTPAAEIAARVKTAASELGYVANAQAQALARSSTRLVGLVVHDISDPYFSTIARGVQHHAMTGKRQVLLASTDHSESAEEDAVAAFVSYRTDAIILAGSRRAKPDEALKATLAGYLANGGRVVTLGESDIPGAAHVRIDNESGAHQLATALVGRGVRRFAILAGPVQLNTARDRVTGFRRALAGAGLEPEAVVVDGFSSRGGYDAALACWQQVSAAPAHGTEPLCMLAVNDVMALGAMTAMRSLGLAVPGDVQVAGFDDIPTLRDHWPSLTTYRLPLEEIGRQAAMLALAGPAAGTPVIGGKVVLRESAGQ